MELYSFHQSKTPLWSTCLRICSPPAVSVFQLRAPIFLLWQNGCCRTATPWSLLGLESMFASLVPSTIPYNYPDRPCPRIVVALLRTTTISRRLHLRRRRRFFCCFFLGLF